MKYYMAIVLAAALVLSGCSGKISGGATTVPPTELTPIVQPTQTPAETADSAQATPLVDQQESFEIEQSSVKDGLTITIEKVDSLLSTDYGSWRPTIDVFITLKNDTQLDMPISPEDSIIILKDSGEVVPCDIDYTPEFPDKLAAGEQYSSYLRYATNHTSNKDISAFEIIFHNGNPTALDRSFDIQLSGRVYDSQVHSNVIAGIKKTLESQMQNTSYFEQYLQIDQAVDMGEIRIELPYIAFVRQQPYENQNYDFIVIPMFISSINGDYTEFHQEDITVETSEGNTLPVEEAMTGTLPYDYYKGSFRFYYAAFCMREGDYTSLKSITLKFPQVVVDGKTNPGKEITIPLELKEIEETK